MPFGSKGHPIFRGTLSAKANGYHIIGRQRSGSETKRHRYPGIYAPVFTSYKKALYKRACRAG